MSSTELTLETASGVCTRSLVTAILESRRAYQLAMALAKQVLLTGPQAQLQWDDAALTDLAPTPAMSWARHAERVRPAELRFSMRRRTPRHGLRLVLPNHFGSPLVMPADSSYSSAGERTNEQADDRRELDADQGQRPRDMGKADGR